MPDASKLCIFPSLLGSKRHLGAPASGIAGEDSGRSLNIAMSYLRSFPNPSRLSVGANHS